MAENREKIYTQEIPNCQESAMPVSTEDMLKAPIETVDDETGASDSEKVKIFFSKGNKEAYEEVLSSMADINPPLAFEGVLNEEPIGPENEGGTIARLGEIGGWRVGPAIEPAGEDEADIFDQGLSTEGIATDNHLRLYLNEVSRTPLLTTVKKSSYSKELTKVTKKHSRQCAVPICDWL